MEIYPTENNLIENQTNYGFGKVTSLSFDEAIVAITAALKDKGFGVLTEIDVKATLKKKIGVDVRPYIILGACNPPLAHQALQAEPELGLLLPCNVIVYDNGDNSCTISLIDPLQMMGVVQNPALDVIAVEAKARLRAALNAVEG